MIAKLLQLSVFLLFTLQMSAQCDDPNNVPINDSPFLDSDNAGPWDLATFHTGSTCCAVGSSDDPTADWPNLECGGASNENAVWYSFTPTGSFEGFIVNVDPAGSSISGNMTVEVYSSPIAGGVTNPGNLTLIDASCTDLSVEIDVSVCDPSLVYYIKVGSSDVECGDFTISVDERNSNCAADKCVDAEVLITETPVRCEDGETILSIEGCLGFACPEDINVACMSEEGPTVWYQLDIDSDQATILLTEVHTDGFDVTWSIWQSTTGSCDDMINVSEPEPAPDPAIPCGNPGLDDIYLKIPIVQDSLGTPATYWIAITALGEIQDPSFTLNYASSLGCIACSGDDAFDCDNGDFSASIDGEEVLLEDYQNFCPGQEVEVCVAFNYNTSGTGNDWLHGMIPTFGNGWDLESVDFEAVDIGGQFGQANNFSGAIWVDYEGPCATTTSIYDLPNLCTYTNSDNVLQLCNTVCDPTCPCEGPMVAGSQMPSGWFWNTEGGSTTCINGSCIPIESFGFSGGVNVDVDFCFLITTKSLDAVNCTENRDLSISFQTTSDAVTGCWEDNPCILDPSMVGPNWEINCNASVAVLAVPESVEICGSDHISVTLSTEDNSASQITVTPIINPNISGANTYSFDQGVGSIIDELTLSEEITVPQIQKYILTANSGNDGCIIIETELEVTIHPVPQIEFVSSSLACIGETIDVGVLIAPQNTDAEYAWSTGAVTDEINVVVNEDTEYCVTITSNGCIEVACTQVNISETNVVNDFEIPICIGESIILTGGTGDLSALYAWDTGETTESITVSPLDSTTYCVTIVDDICQRVECTTVNVRADFVIDLTPDTEICRDQTIAVVAVEIANGTYLWSTGETTNVINVSPTESTSYCVTISNGSCVHEDCVNITVDQANNCSEQLIPTLVFFDESDDGVFNGDESFIENYQVIVSPDNASYTINNNINGLHLDVGEYSVSMAINGFSYEVTTMPLTYDFEVGYEPFEDTLIWGVKVLDDVDSLKTYIGHGNLTCNEDEFFSVQVSNYGVFSESGTLWFEIDENMEVADQLSAEPDVMIGDYLMGWNYTDLLPLSTFKINLLVTMPGPPDLAIGESLFSRSFVTENEDLDTELAHYSITNVVTCSYDPNDKTVIPSDGDSYSNIDDEYYYSIRFQNLGNGPATRVVILDTLDVAFDASTFTYLHSSHERDLSVRVVEDHILQFVFDGILLPPAEQDSAASQGYVSYKISIAEGVEEGTIVSNIASIYFDFNPAIVTNTTMNLLYKDADMDGFFSIDDCDDTNPDINPSATDIPNNGIDENCDGGDLTTSTLDIQGKEIKVTPNPAVDQVNINYEGQSFQVEMYNATGQYIMGQSTANSQMVIDLENLNPGVYIIKLIDSNLSRSTAFKLVKL